MQKNEMVIGALTFGRHGKLLLFILMSMAYIFYEKLLFIDVYGLYLLCKAFIY